MARRFGAIYDELEEAKKKDAQYPASSNSYAIVGENVSSDMWEDPWVESGATFDYYCPAPYTKYVLRSVGPNGVPDVDLKRAYKAHFSGVGDVTPVFELWGSSEFHPQTPAAGDYLMFSDEV